MDIILIDILMEALQKAYKKGYDEGYKKCTEDTFREKYEKLCEEIRATSRQEVIDELKSYYKVNRE